MRYIFIINPVAGKKNAYDFLYNSISKTAEILGANFECLLTNGVMHAKEITQRIGKEGMPARIYACGGDGTLCEVANGAIGYDNLEIGVIPSGSGNDFIRSFSNPKAFMNLEKQFNADSIYLDMIKTQNLYALNVWSMGLDAEVAQQMNKFKRIPFINGSMAYHLAVIKQFLGKLGKEVEIIIDGKESYSGSYLFAIAANGEFYGGGYHCAPNAMLEDGMLEMILIKTPKLLRVPGLINLYKSGEYIHSDKIKDLLHYCRGKKMEIKSKNKICTNYDGEIVMNDFEKIEILPSAIRFLIPDGAPNNLYRKDCKDGNTLLRQKVLAGS